MAKLLYLENSPRKERSASIEVARTFLDAYRDTHPGDEIDPVDVWDLDMPEFDGEALNAKYAILHGQSHTPEQAAAWGRVAALAERFKSADKYLIGLPMWNFGIPYKLKQFIDIITQPTLTFSFTPEEGYKGLVKNKPAAVIYARGGEYPTGSPAEGYDLQRRYMELWLGFIGFTDIRAIPVEPTLNAPDVVAKAKDDAKRRAAAIARAF